ncbi:MAG: ATP-binding protein [Niabella sp.]
MSFTDSIPRHNSTITIVLWVSIVLLFGLGIYTGIKIIYFKNKVEKVNKTGLVISKTQELLNALQEVESSYNDFVFRNDSAILPKFEVNKSILNLRFADIQKADLDQSQQNILDSIFHLYKEQINDISTHSDKVYQSSKIRYLTTVFLNNQKALLDKLHNEENEIYKNIIWFISCTALLAMLLLIITTIYATRVYKRLEKIRFTLKKSRNRLESMLEELPVGVIIVNNVKNTYHLNKRGASLLKDINKDDSFESYNNNLFQNLLLPSAYNGENSNGQETSMLVNDEEMFLKVSSIPLYDKDKMIRYCVAVFDDITKVKMAEAELIKAKKLTDESLKLKEIFLANMSHEIRTPMNAILGFTELLTQKDLGNTENEYVSIIHSAGHNLLRIINDVLDFSKLNASMMIFEELNTSIKETISNIINLLLPRANEKNIKLFYTHDNRLPEMIITDPVRLTQVITNIVGNAIKFTDEGFVKVASHFITETNNTITVRFDIEDTGIGIPEDKLNNIFERFGQEVDNKKYGGSGLGLSIAKHIVEIFNGDIQVMSTEGKGSLFTVTIPFLKQKQLISATKEFETKQPMLCDTLKLFLVEDNHFNIKLIKGIFLNYDIVLDIAETGNDALEKLRNANYNLILLDVQLPDTTGCLLAHTLRKQGNTTPIIAITAHALAGEKEKCMAAGINEYLTKPINTAVLFKKIEELTKTELKKCNLPASQLESEKQPSLISLDYLSEISNENPDFEAEILNEFIVQAKTKISEIDTAIIHQDFASLKANFHNLKSIAAIFFKENIKEEIEKLEYAVSNQQFSSDDYTRYQTIKTIINKGTKEVEDILKKNYSHST